MSRDRIVRQPDLRGIGGPADQRTQSFASVGVRGGCAQAQHSAVDGLETACRPGLCDGARDRANGVALQPTDALDLDDLASGRVAQPDPRLTPIHPQHLSHPVRLVCMVESMDRPGRSR